MLACLPKLGAGTADFSVELRAWFFNTLSFLLRSFDA
jgi:hypothetical protein